MKLSDIKPKYLVLGQDYDDFALATDKVNFDEEDLCCQLINLTAVYYWINTESVWGPMGFNWINYNNNGIFNKSTIMFTIIPRIPDSNRHQTLHKTFDNINTSIKLLDSNWKHIKLLCYLSYNNIYITLVINSLQDTIISSDKKITNVFSDSILRNLYLFEGNSNVLNVTNIKARLTSKNIKLDSIKLGYCNITIDSGDDEVDMKDFFTNLDVYHDSSYFKISFYPSFINIYARKKLIEYSLYYNHDSVFLSNHISTNNTSIFEEIKYVLNPKVHDNNIDTIINNNGKIAKKFIYEGIENYNAINFYYLYGYFEDIPEITQDKINITTINIFRHCRLGRYNYGSLFAEEKIFDKLCTNTMLSDYISLKKIYKYNNLNGTLSPDGSKIVDYSNNIDIKFKNNSDKVVYPIFNNNIEYFYVFDLGDINWYNNNKVVNFNFRSDMFINKTGHIKLMDACSLEKYCLINKSNYLIIEYSSEFDLKTLYFDTDDITITNIIKFNITKENIINNKNIINMLLYFSFNKHKFNIENEFIARNSTITIEDIYLWNKYMPSVSTKIIIYNCDINIVYNSDTDKVINLLNNIVCIGNIEDSKNKTIRILSKYYQSMLNETKNKLIGDGYTIIEIL